MKLIDFFLNRRNYIAVYVIGYLLRGIIYHFFPVINDILMWITIIWPVILIANDIMKRSIQMDGLKYALAVFLTVACISTIIHFQESTAEAWVSLWNAVSLMYLLFTAPDMEEGKQYLKFFDRISLISWGIICFLAAGSLVLFECYTHDIVLPGNLASADRIFTYGHLGQDLRFCGLFGYSTVGGNLCALGVFLSFFLYEQKKLNGWLSVISAVILVITIYLLDVRTSAVELAFSGLLFLYFKLRKKLSAGKSICLILGGVIILSGLVFFLKQDQIRNLMVQLNTDPEGTLRFLTTGRSEYWMQAFNAFLQNPILGQGWNNNAGVQFFDCHNLLFNVLLWTGLLGTTSLFTFFILLIRKILKRKKEISEYKLISLILLIFGIFVASMLERTLIGTDNTTADASFFWLSAGTLAYYPGMKPDGKAN